MLQATKVASCRQQASCLGLSPRIFFVKQSNPRTLKVAARPFFGELSTILRSLRRGYANAEVLGGGSGLDNE